MSDLEGRLFTKRPGALVASDQFADEFMAGIPDGKTVLVTVRRPRSPQHHRFFFALLRKVVDNSDDWNDTEELLDALKIASGHTRPVLCFDGSITRVPRSIDFASMGEDVFTRFKNRALYLLGRILGVAPETLMVEVASEMQGKNRRAA